MAFPSVTIMMQTYLSYALLALFSLVQALEVYPPDYIDLPRGKIVTVVPPNREPVGISHGIGVSKIASHSTLKCAKNVHYGCPGVQLIPTASYDASKMNGCGPEAEIKLAKMFNRIIDVPWAHECCNQHDVCFGRCDSDYSQCNLDFEDCLLRSCPAQWNPLEKITCATFEPIYIAAVDSKMGCHVYTHVDPKKDPDCRCPNTTVPIRQEGHYRQYFWILDEYTSDQLRSRLHDTITIMIGVDINEVPSAGGELRKFQGKQSGGHKSIPGMEIDFWAFDDDEVTLWITMYNGDLSPKSIAELKEAANIWSPATVINFAAETSRTPLYSGMNYLSIMTGGASSSLWNWLFGPLTAKCDGWVVQTTVRTNGTYLATLNGQAIIDEIRTGSVAGQGCNKQLSAYHYRARYGLKAEGGVLIKDSDYRYPIGPSP
jgi:hypothetical protein